MTITSEDIRLANELSRRLSNEHGAHRWKVSLRTREDNGQTEFVATLQHNIDHIEIAHVDPAWLILDLRRHERGKGFTTDPIRSGEAADGAN